MTTLTLGGVLGLLGLGALHGINPAMGWLFAVALGLQEKGGRAVWRALPPLALGHALAIGAVVALAVLVGLVIPPAVLRWMVALSLIGFGVYRLVRHQHPRYGGMRVGARELTIWSFLMASAHGAGLMVLPFLLSNGGAVGAAAHAAHGAAGHGAHVAAVGGLAAGQMTGLLMTLVHTAGYLLVTGVVAVVVYERVGLKLLRSAWINLDLIWAGALVLTGLGALLV